MKYDCNYDCDALHEAYEAGRREQQKECDTCLFQRHKEILEEHDAEVRKTVLAEVEQKIYELELNYEALYGCAIQEACADVVADLLEWIQGGQKNDE